MKYCLPFLLVMTLMISGCYRGNPNTKTELLEIYSTKGNRMNKSIDSLRYFESAEFTDEKKNATSYFDNNGNLTGKEQLEYVEGRLKSGKYYDPAGKLLSTYQYILDHEGRVIAEYGFDESNKKLLSIKSFVYDPNGNITTRKVFEADYSLYRKYDFTFDFIGNEKEMVVTDEQGELVLKEEFKIVAKDSSGLWTEKWGFINDVPVTYYKKS